MQNLKQSGRSLSLSGPLLQELVPHHARSDSRILVQCGLLVTLGITALLIVAPCTKAWASPVHPLELVSSVHRNTADPLKARATLKQTTHPQRWNLFTHSASRSALVSLRRSVSARVSTGDRVSTEDMLEGVECEDEDECPVPTDFYSLLDVDMDASPDQIKSSYRRIAKSCHPDIAGPDATDVCVLVSNAYDTLMDPVKKEAYDTEIRREMIDFGDLQGYTGRPLSRWVRNDPGRGPDEQRAVFVDESTCIGCRMCVNLAAETFGTESMYGRARVHSQWANEEDDVKAAVESCPVDCIHFVDKQALPVLEWCMRQAERAPIAVMATGFGTGEDPFEMAKDFIRRGEERMGRLRAETLGMDPDLNVWGKSESQIQFSLAMQSAWDKLTRKTKQAWSGMTKSQESLPSR